MRQKNIIIALNRILNRGFVRLHLIAVLLSLSFISHSYSQYIYKDGAEISNISPLMSAVHSNDIDGIKFFSKAGRSVLNNKNIGGATALHIASRQGNLEAAEILISSGADTDMVDNDGWTPLMRAAVNNKPEVVSKLLASGASANSKNNMNETAIVHATTSGCTQCLKSVLNYVDYDKIDKRLLDSQIEEAFLIANKREDTATKEVLNQYQDKIGREDYPTIFKDGEDDNLLEDLTKQDEDLIIKYKPEVEKVVDYNMTPPEPKPLIISKTRYKRRYSLISPKEDRRRQKDQIDFRKKIIKRKEYFLIKGKDGIYDLSRGEMDMREGVEGGMAIDDIIINDDFTRENLSPAQKEEKQWWRFWKEDSSQDQSQGMKKNEVMITIPQEEDVISREEQGEKPYLRPKKVFSLKETTDQQSKESVKDGDIYTKKKSSIKETTPQKIIINKPASKKNSFSFTRKKDIHKPLRAQEMHEVIEEDLGDEKKIEEIRQPAIINDYHRNDPVSNEDSSNDSNSSGRRYIFFKKKNSNKEEVAKTVPRLKENKFFYFPKK